MEEINTEEKEIFYDAMDDIFEEKPIDMIDKVLPNNSEEEANVSLDFGKDGSEEKKAKIVENDIRKLKIKEPVDLIDQVMASTSGVGTEMKKSFRLENYEAATEENKVGVSEKDTGKQKVKKQKMNTMPKKKKPKGIPEKKKKPLNKDKKSGESEKKVPRKKNIKKTEPEPTAEKKKKPGKGKPKESGKKVYGKRRGKK